MSIAHGEKAHLLRVGDLARLSGKTVRAIRLYEELGIDTLEKLWWATHQQRVRHLPGFGARSEARIKAAVEQLLKGRQKVLKQGAA